MQASEGVAAVAGDRVLAQESLRSIVRQATDRSFAQLPPDVVRLAKHCMLDWLGVAIAAARTPLVSTLVDALGAGEGNTTLVGRPERAPLLDALLINGTSGHFLDYDDVHCAIPGHVSVALAPVILGLGEARKTSGEQWIASFVAGFEAMCGLARLVGDAHAKAGFHATATMGAFGAAVSACHMDGATEEQMVAAIANASTQAAGLRSAFGTPCKSLQVGRASANGCFSALLALRGVNGSEDSFVGRDGFMATHGATWTNDSGAPRDYFLREVLFKFNASCFVTHAPMECLRKLMSERDLSFQAVRRILIRVHPSAERICAIPHPGTSLEAKFSLQHTAAMVLSNLDTSDVQSFENQGAFATLRPWRDKIQLVFDASIPAPRSTVVVEFGDDSTLQAEHDSEVPENDLDRQEARLISKFTALASPVLGAGATAELCRHVLQLESQSDSGPLVSLCRID